MASPGGPLRTVDAGPRQPDTHEVHFVLFVGGHLLLGLRAVVVAVIEANAHEGSAVLELEVAAVGGADAQETAANILVAGTGAHAEIQRALVGGGVEHRPLGIGDAQAVLPRTGLLRRKAHGPHRFAGGYKMRVAAVLGNVVGLEDKPWLGDGGFPAVIGEQAIDGDADPGLDTRGRIGVVGHIQRGGGGLHVELNFKFFVHGRAAADNLQVAHLGR